MTARFITVITILLTAFALAAQGNPYDTRRFEELCKRYQLDAVRQQKLQQILTMSAGQRRMDRQNFAPMALALYQAAKARKERENQLIGDLLDEEQRSQFKRQEQSPQKVEFYMYQEGLLLDEQQIAQLTGIIGDPGRGPNPDGFGEGPQPPQGNPPQPGPDRQAGPGARHDEGDLVDNWVSVQKKRAKSIKSILKKEQVAQFEILFAMYLKEGKHKLQQLQHEREKGRPQPRN